MSGLLDGIEGVFIDFYGTIAAGDREAVHDACAAIVEQVGLAMTPDELAVRWGEVFFETMGRSNNHEFRTLAQCEADSLRDTLAPLVGPVDPWPLVGLLVDYWRQPPLFDDAIKALATMPVPVCCVSNVDSDDLRLACHHHGLWFAEAVTSEDARSYKPHGGIFREALRRTGWDPRRVVHIGDSLHSDVGGAQAAGLRAFWLCRESRIHDIGTATPEATIASLVELTP